MLIDDNNIKWLKDISTINNTEIGYKAIRLVELYKAHFPVPRAFVINAKYYFSFLQKNNLKEKIKEIISEINYSDKKDIENKSKEIKKIFKKNKVDDDFNKELLKMYDKIGGTQIGWLNSKADEFVALRTSISSEDYKPEDLEFIEKYSGYLNIKGAQNLIGKLIECWESLYDAEILEYANSKNINLENIGISIIVQKMVNANQSGTVITTKKINNTPYIFVEAIYGYGGKSLITEITPDNYMINKKNLSIAKRIKSDQEWMLKRMVGKTTKVKIDPELNKKYKLDGREVRELSEMAKKMELFFGMPLSIDWVRDKSNDIYILSADPLDISLKKVKKKKKAEFQDKLDSFKKKMIIEGIPVSEGIVNGTVKIVKTQKDLEDINENTILVTKMTNLEMTAAVKRAKAVVTDAGSTICHAALVSKKHSVPCIVHTQYATSMLKNNQNIQVNGFNGKVFDLTGIKLVNMEDSKNNLKKKEIKIKEKEAEYPKTVTEVIVKLKSIEELEKINFSDIDGFLIELNSLFEKEFLEDILKDYSTLINQVKAKINLLLSYTKNKKVYYKINTHSQDLTDKNTANYEIEAILDNSVSSKINIVLDNIKSSKEILPIKESSENNLGVVINKIQINIIEDHISNGVENLVFDLDEFDKELKNAIGICKENKISRLVDIKKEYNNEIIKNIIEYKANSVIIDYEQIAVKETIYKKEQEMLKNLLSI